MSALSLAIDASNGWATDRVLAEHDQIVSVFLISYHRKLCSDKPEFT